MGALRTVRAFSERQFPSNTAQMGSSAKVDEEAFEACMKEVTKALLEA